MKKLPRVSLRHLREDRGICGVENFVLFGKALYNEREIWYNIEEEKCQVL